MNYVEWQTGNWVASLKAKLDTVGILPDIQDLLELGPPGKTAQRKIQVRKWKPFVEGPCGPHVVTIFRGPGSSQDAGCTCSALLIFDL